jgi:hypothetical protein
MNRLAFSGVSAITLLVATVSVVVSQGPIVNAQQHLQPEQQVACSGSKTRQSDGQQAPDTRQV